MPPFLGEILASSLSPVSAGFILVILCIWAVFNLRYSPSVVEPGPTIGIFGTFLGVAPSSAWHWGSRISIPGTCFGAGTARDAGEAPADPVALLVAIRDALAGPGDASLLSQMKPARQDTNDRLLSQRRMARQDSNERLDICRRLHR